MEDSTYWQNRPKNDERVDWRTGGDWITEYANSRNHPHRELIVNALKSFNFRSLFEIGCNAAPNLVNIDKNFPGTELAGMDVNKDVIDRAKLELPTVELVCGDMRSGLVDKKFDVVLADAVLMYINDQEIHRVINDIGHMSSKYVIIIDWWNPSLEGVVEDHHWCRNYKKLLELKGFEVEAKKLTEEQWPSKIWAKNGYIFIGKRVVPSLGKTLEPEIEMSLRTGHNIGA